MLEDVWKFNFLTNVWQKVDIPSGLSPGPFARAEVSAKTVTNVFPFFEEKMVRPLLSTTLL